MPLWGNKDGEDIYDTSSGIQYTCTSGGTTITFGSSIAAHDPQVGDTLILDATAVGGVEHHKIIRVTSPTVLEIATAVGHTSTGNGTYAVEISKAPKYTESADVGTVIGVSVTEKESIPVHNLGVAHGAGMGHIGWVKKHTKNRGGVETTWFETLVASSSISEDTQTGDISPSVGL